MSFASIWTPTPSHLSSPIVIWFCVFHHPVEGILESSWHASWCCQTYTEMAKTESHQPPFSWSINQSFLDCTKRRLSGVLWKTKCHGKSSNSVNGEGFTSCMLTAQESLSNNVVWNILIMILMTNETTRWSNLRYTYSSTLETLQIYLNYCCAHHPIWV